MLDVKGSWQMSHRRPVRIGTNRWFAMIVGAAIWLASQFASAGYPASPYFVLRDPTGGAHGHHSAPSTATGYAIPVQRSGYAYGYFGAAPRHHWSKHYGYYRNYTQWSAQ